MLDVTWTEDPKPLDEKRSTTIGILGGNPSYGLHMDCLCGNLSEVNDSDFYQTQLNQMIT